MNGQPATHPPDSARRSIKWRGTFVYWSVALTLILAVSVLHFWKLGSAPKGFYTDEASIAYNAYCIAQTGADEYGNKYPLYFRSVSYQDPVMSYSSVPLVELFGLHEWVARLPSALFYILASVAFGLLVREYCRNKWLSLFGGLLFALTPWGFAISRTVGPGQSPMLFGMAAGWLFSLRAVRKRSFHCAVAAGAAFALAMYAYNAGRLMSPLLLVCFAVAFNRMLRSRWKVTAVLLTVYITALLPMIVSVVRAPQVFADRFQQVSLFADHPSWTVALAEITTRYMDYFSPRFLFFTGDHELRHHTGSCGELFWFTIPLILAGLYCVARFFRTQPYYRFLVLGLLAYPAAAVLTVDRMHSMRCVNGVIAWLLLAMVGAHWLWQQRRVGRKLLVVACAVGALESLAYLADYFGPYQKLCRHAFMAGLSEGLKYSFQRINSNQTFYVDDSVGVPYGIYIHTDFKPLIYAHLLFYGKIDPRSYQRDGLSNSVVQPYLGRIQKPGLLLRANYTSRRSDLSPSAGMQNHIPVPSGAKLLATFEEGTPLEYEVFEVR